MILIKLCAYKSAVKSFKTLMCSGSLSMRQNNYQQTSIKPHFKKNSLLNMNTILHFKVKMTPQWTGHISRLVCMNMHISKKLNYNYVAFKIGIPPFTFYQGKRSLRPRNKVKLGQIKRSSQTAGLNVMSINIKQALIQFSVTQFSISMEYFIFPSSKPHIDQAIKDINFSLRSGPVNTNNRSCKTG